MSQERAILVSSEELMVIAAAGGLKHILLFNPQNSEDRGQQIQAVHHLLRDGFLSSRPAGLTVSEWLRPVVLALRGHRRAVIVRTTRDELSPFCLYLQQNRDEAVYVAPSPNRSNLYRLERVPITGMGGLLEPYLPSVEESVVPEDDSALSPLAPDWREKISLYELTETLGTTDLTLFERYSADSAACEERMAVYRGTYSWVISRWNPEGVETLNYAKRDVLRWLTEDVK